MDLVTLQFKLFAKRDVLSSDVCRNGPVIRSDLLMIDCKLVQRKIQIHVLYIYMVWYDKLTAHTRIRADFVLGLFPPMGQICVVCIVCCDELAANLCLLVMCWLFCSLFLSLSLLLFIFIVFVYFCLNQISHHVVHIYSNA